MKEGVSLRASASLAVLACVSLPAYAQSQASDPTVVHQQAKAAVEQDAVADIVVTANRPEQNLQDVGIAVAAFSGDTLKKMGVSNSADIAQLTPGVYASGSLGGQSQQFTVRGVTQSDFNDAIESPVAVYVDDVYVPTQQGQSLALFDVQRVEVLKGPQGTLFGRTLLAGWSTLWSSSLVSTGYRDMPTSVMGDSATSRRRRVSMSPSESGRHCACRDITIASAIIGRMSIPKALRPAPRSTSVPLASAPRHAARMKAGARPTPAVSS